MLLGSELTNAEQELRVKDMPQAKKSLGQHWLTDQASLEAICDAAGVKKGDFVLEIGPGTGELTAKLLDRGANVLALEIDQTLHPALENRFASYGSQLTLQAGDIRNYDLTNLPVGYKMVANIPYYLTANLLRILTDTPYKPARAALLVQKEVAERVSAKPGDMSFISLSTQLFYEVNLGWLVPANLFIPMPKVDSQVLILRLRDQSLFGDIDVKAFFRIAKAGFSARRKTLLNSLSGGLRLDKDKVEMLCVGAGLKSNIRPQQLNPDDWYALYRAAKKENLI